MLVKTTEKFEGHSVSSFEKNRFSLFFFFEHDKTMYVEILESAFLCNQKVFLHRVKFVLGQLGGCGFTETILNDQI